MIRRSLLAAAVAFATQAAWAQCPAGPVKANTKLTADCLAGGIVVAAPNVYLDLGGKTVRCANPSGTIGIQVLNVKGVRIENGKVEGCTYGIDLVQGGKHTIRKVEMRKNVRGLFLEGSSQNLVDGVTAEANDLGISLTYAGGDATMIGSFDNTFKNMRVVGNKLWGVQIANNSTDNDVIDSVISKNGIGISTDARSGRNSIIHNTLEENTSVAINPTSSTYVANNIVKKNLNLGGIVVYGTNNIVMGNFVTGNTGNGIAIGTPNTVEQVDANTVKVNTAFGTIGGYDLADYAFGTDRCAENDWMLNLGFTLYDRCEIFGGNPDDLTAVATGTAGTNRFEINARRRHSGVSTGHAKVLEVVNPYGAPAEVEGSVTCLEVDSTGNRATVGMIIDKSNRPELVYKTLHVHLSDGVPVSGKVVDQLAVATVNKFAPGECPISSAGGVTLSKGKVAVDVR
ncbi:MAG: right-handed parallel beta-helix repeat-containing protein [Bryobacterales bacterium]|nr:right-handed parallel beta-helix repeat-containing protein [Bryobacterales bacterium]